jgi:arsenate reductase
MAEGFAKHLKADTIEASSAGTDPRCLDPYAVMVMKEIGIDILDYRPKHIGSVGEIPFDYAVIVCSYVNEFRPTLHKRTTIIPCEFVDPASLIGSARTSQDILKGYRRVRDEIRAFIESCPDSLFHSDA